MDRFGFGKSSTGRPDGRSDDSLSRSSLNSSSTGSNIIPKFMKATHDLPLPRIRRGEPEHVLRAANCPNNAFALSNVLAVNPQDGIKDGSYVICDNLYVLTAKTTTEVAPGTVGANANQRLWLGWSLNQEVSLRGFDLFASTGKQAYLGTLNVEISFRSKAKAVDTQFDQDELSKVFIANFESQIFQPSQVIIMDFRGIVFEIVVKGVQVIDLSEISAGGMSGDVSSNIMTKGILVKQTQINFFKGRDGLVNLKSSSIRPRADAIIRPDFKFEDMGIGGLDEEFTSIFRRAFASRIFPPALIEKLGIQHVKGLLLFGPPGTGKTLIARRIGTMLNAREPKIVNGPEILSKYVGSSEENIRNLFKDAEAEYKAKGDDSSLHIIIFDELDSVFKQRGSRGDGTGVADNVVNQLLAKMDGVDQLNNILVIGMTNRKDLIDSALLRPGRFEVQVEISLPDEKGRKQILEIKTKKMRDSKMLASDVDLGELAALTKNFSGAEIEGLVKSASSFAINRHIKVGSVAAISDDVKNMKVTRQDFLRALDEVEPAFGVNEEELESHIRAGIIPYSPSIADILKTGKVYARQVRESPDADLISVLMHGPESSGKTALAAKIALDSEFPLVRFISAEATVGMSEAARITYIDNTFRDCYRSPLNVLVIDSIESLVDWVPIGPRFSNAVLQTLKVCLKKKPPKGKKLLLISTTSTYSVLAQMDILSCFGDEVAVPNVKTFEELRNIMDQMNYLTPESREKIITRLADQTPSGRINVGIKRVLANLRTAAFDTDPETEAVELLSRSMASSPLNRA